MMARKQTLPVVFPPMGITHVIGDLSDLVAPWCAEASRIEVVFASQPNSYPHLGTITTLLSTFAVAARLQSKLGLQTSVVFDCLENSPSPRPEDRFEALGRVYQRSLADARVAEGSLADHYMRGFERLLQWASKRSGMPFRIRSYREFQRIATVRQGIEEIIRRRQVMARILSPGHQELHVRFPCPVCRRVDKSASSLRVRDLDRARGLILTESCPEHGEHSICIGPDSDDFIDTNAAIRDVLKGLLGMDQFRSTGVLTVMCDGGDWGGTWALAVFAQALAELGQPFKGVPIRLFAPMILDWSGAKFSKSLYVSSTAYEHIPVSLIDFSAFEAEFGIEGLDPIWFEVSGWASTPQRFFRNYSLDYMSRLLRDADQGRERQLSLEFANQSESTPPLLKNAFRRTPILISLDEKYYQLIVAGSKRHEYRRRFRQEETFAFVYVKHPIAGIAAALVLDEPIVGPPTVIGTIAEAESPGIGMDSILAYLGERKEGFAVPIRKHIVLKRVVTLPELRKRFEGFAVPQSYILLRNKPELLALLGDLLPSGSVVDE